MFKAIVFGGRFITPAFLAVSNKALSISHFASEQSIAYEAIIYTFDNLALFQSF